MICPSCRNDVEAGSNVCPYCGTPLNAGAQQTMYEQSMYNNQPMNNNQPMAGDKYHGHPMKWYKFLAYFAMWISALAYLGNASKYFGNYDIKVKIADFHGEEVVETFNAFDCCKSGMKSMGVICGVIALCVAALAVFTAISLIKLKKNSFMLLSAVYALGAVVNTVFMCALNSNIDGILYKGTWIQITIPDFSSSVTGFIVVAVVMIAANYKYFNNRKDVFVN